MVTRGIEPITLPWKRPEKGVSAAELGASFRVEQREDGWHCTVRVGRHAEVLATGLRRLRDAQCRAEAHAATLPEVAAALANVKAEAEASKPAAKGGRKGPVRAPVVEERAPEPSSAEDVGPVQPWARSARRTGAPTFEQVSDGCICGKIDGGTWVADPAGKVSVPEGTDPAVAQEICRVAAKHYAGQRQKTAAPGRAAKPASRATAKPVADAAPVDPPRRAGKGKRGKGKAARKKLATKLAAKPGARTRAKTATAPDVEKTAKPAARTVKKTRAKTAKQAAGDAKKTTARAAKKAAVVKQSTAEAAKKTRAKTAAKSAAKPAAKTTARAAAQVAAPTDAGQRGRGRKGNPAVAPAEAKEEPMAKKTGKASKGESCGCTTWTEADGKARGEAKHGAFVIEPEGKKHALYFYDLDGQSRHLQSGEAGKLRKVADEMAARDQPASRAASAGDDAALLKMFMTGAMEDET